MPRSRTKGPFIDRFFLSSTFKKSCQRHRNKRFFVHRMVKLYTRSSVIIPSLLGRNFKIHNGKEFLRVYVTKPMIGHKFGEFAHTRQRHEFKVKKKKGKKK